MKVSGLSIIRNGMKFGYPIVEAVTSVLPLCDEFILNVGKSDDDTLELVKGIDSPKLIILEREWDMTLREGGQLISVETNNALDRCTGEWCFYIQADEVLHEKFIPAVRSAMVTFVSDEKVEALQFRYRHFYGSYDFVQDNFRSWYVKESRVIKRHPNIVSWGDGTNFRHRDNSALKAKQINAEIYHYGWVRPPQVMHTKSIGFNQLYTKSDEQVKRMVPAVEQTYYDIGNLKRFTGTHPAVMTARVAASNWAFDSKIDEQPPDWLRYIKLFFQPLTKRLKRWFSSGGTL